MSIRKVLPLIVSFVIVIAVSGCGTRVYEAPTPQRASVPARGTAIVTVPEVVSPVPTQTKPASRPTPKRGRKQRREKRPTRQLQSQPQLHSQPQTQQLSSYETTFNAKEKNRGINITRATESINNKVVKPGEEFSFNETVGPTIKRRGYEKAMIYKNGEKAEGEGGGVCQVSSTLHMAAAKAGMTIIERHDHSLPVTYAKSGEEAAVSYGVQDFKFKNDKSHPVQIKSHVNDGTIKVSIYAVS